MRHMNNYPMKSTDYPHHCIPALLKFCVKINRLPTGNSPEIIAMVEIMKCSIQVEHNSNTGD